MVILHKDCYILKCRRNRFNEKLVIPITSKGSKLHKGRREDTIV